MASFVHAGEAEISGLACLAVFGTIYDEWDVAGFREISRVRIGDLVGDGLTPEPVADVVGVAVDQSNTYAVVEDKLEVVKEDWVGKVAGLLERVENVGVGLRIVQVNAEGLLDLRQVKEIIEVFGGSGILEGVTDVINPSATVCIIRLLHVGAALVSGLSNLILAEERVNDQSSETHLKA